MSIERLTAVEREWLALNANYAHKALRIIDALTEALEFANDSLEACKRNGKSLSEMLTAAESSLASTSRACDNERATRMASESECAQMRVKLARAESILRGNGGYWASQALEALRGS